MSLALDEYNQGKVIKKEGLKKVAFAKKTLFSACKFSNCLHIFAVYRIWAFYIPTKDKFFSDMGPNFGQDCIRDEKFFAGREI